MTADSVTASICFKIDYVLRGQVMMTRSASYSLKVLCEVL